MKKLLAPNGKPSNLTPEQYKLVRTPAFKKWFGDWENDPENASKVVDENGEPLVCYHGTDTKFNVFNKSFIGSNFKLDKIGFFFTSSYDSANMSRPSYPQKSKYKWTDEDKSNSKSGFLISSFLNIRIPLQINEVNNIIYDSGVSAINTFDHNRELISESILKLNKDGFILKKEGEYLIVAINSNQIKLADGSNTTFDENNDDIRYESGGEIDLKIISDRKGIIDYLTKNAGRWYQRDSDELNELFNSNIYIEQDDEIVKELSKEYVNFYKKNPNFKKIPLIIYEDKSSKDFGERELFRYDFFNDAIILSSKKEFKELKNTKTIPINDICGFTYEKYENKVYGSLMHEYGHSITFGKVGYIKDDWFNENYNKIVNNISLYAGEKKVEFLAEVFALKNISNFNELDKEKKDFIINNYDNLFFERGGRTIAQTPAPKKERIYGSNTNKEKSSQSNTSAKQIVFDEKTIKSIKNKIDKHNEENPDKLITLSSAKAVVRRGMGAYSKSHRPTIKGGKPNSRVAWGLARLNAFIYKIKNGVSKSGKYIQDDDLINELNIKYNIGGEISKQSINNVKNDKINYLNVLNSVWSFFGIKLD
jgi:hypothetical protein